MSALLKKIHFKSRSPFVVLHLPDELKEEFDEATGYLSRVEELNEPSPFVLIFIFNKQQLLERIPKVVSLLQADALFWIAYPKKSSKKYKTDLTRDHGWDVLGEYGFEPVSLVSLNEDFSIFRARHVKYIKNMIRPEAAKLTKSSK
jgi:hypothetical protein